MINPLRSRHRWMAPVFLGAVPAVVLIGAIAGRPAAPVTADLPAAIASVEAMPTDRTSLGPIWSDLPLEVSLGNTPEGSQLIVEIRDAPLKPDLLLFWSPADAVLRVTPESDDHNVAETDGGQLPAGSVFLGVFRETTSAVFALPEATLAGQGRLVLYSLPHRQVVSVSRPVNLN